MVDMPTVIHGENHVQSREFLGQLIAKSRSGGMSDIQRMDGRKIDLTDLSQALLSTSLFDESRLVVIEDLHKNLSKTIVKKAVEIISQAAKPPTQNEIILWESKQLTATQCKKLVNFEVKNFKTSPSIFKFLDSFGTHNLKSSLGLLRMSAESDSAQLVFYMLARHTRMMIQAMDGTLKAAPWQKGKLAAQAKLLGAERLFALHEQLMELDYGSKTGQLPFALEHQLELVVLEYSGKMNGGSSLLN